MFDYLQSYLNTIHTSALLLMLAIIIAILFVILQ